MSSVAALMSHRQVKWQFLSVNGRAQRASLKSDNNQYLALSVLFDQGPN